MVDFWPFFRKSSIFEVEKSSIFKIGDFFNRDFRDFGGIQVHAWEIRKIWGSG